MIVLCGVIGTAAVLLGGYVGALLERGGVFERGHL